MYYPSSAECVPMQTSISHIHLFLLSEYGVLVAAERNASDGHYRWQPGCFHLLDTLVFYAGSIVLDEGFCQICNLGGGEGFGSGAYIYAQALTG